MLQPQTDGEIICAPRLLGIDSLPPEVFLHILSLLGQKLLRGKRERRHTIASLSKVSRRFRDGVAQTTAFWAFWDVSKFESGEAARLHMTRGPAHGVILDFTSVRDGESEWCLGFLASPSMRVQFERITELLFVENLVALGAGNQDKVIGLNFPAVQALGLLTRKEGEGVQIRTCEGSNALNSWKFPVLRELTLNFIPHLDMIRGVTHLTLDGLWYDYTFNDLKMMLRGLQSLTHLEVRNLRFWNGSEIEGTEGTVTLPNLISLNVLWTSESAFIFRERFSTKSLDLPRVRDLRIMLDDGCDALRRSMNRVLEMFQRLNSASLRSFLLRIKNLRYVNLMPRIKDIFLTMPTLETATIEYDSMDLRVQEESVQNDEKCHPSLHTLRIITPARSDGSPYEPLQALSTILTSDVDVIVVADSDDQLMQARSLFPRARREWFSDKSILELRSFA